MKNTKLPTHHSIFEESHFPPIDNQGGVGSCASQAIMRNQFTAAVSKIIHQREEGCAFCPHENFDEVFTPKYSYNMVGAGTAWVYEFIRDHGALFQTEGTFKKPETNDKKVLGGSIPHDKDGVRYPESASLHVAPGQMERALRYRLKNFDQIWVTKPPYNEQLTTHEAGQKLLYRIKESLLQGTPVVTGGYPGRWIFTDIEGCGSLGKTGEHICVAAAGNGGGGHQVTIVGYDDDITASFAGVRIKGALLIANSYGIGWQNKGLCWMSYDAVNTLSEFASLNDPALYSGPMYLTPAQNMAMFPPALTQANQTLSFKKSGTYTIYGKTYGAYTVYDEKNGKYLTYKTDAEERTLYFEEKEGKRFAFIPYEELLSFPTSDKQYHNEKYNGSYFVYLADKEGSEEGYRVLDAGLSYGASGRQCGIASHNASRYPEAKAWLLDCAPSDAFISRLAIAAGKGEQSNRIWALDQFCFLDPCKDVLIGMPPYYVKATVSATDRDCFKIYLTRKDKSGGKTKKYLPAMFKYIPCRPFYGKREKGEYLNFEGILKGSECVGEIACSLEALLDFPKGKTFDDYIWGIEMKKGRQGKAKIVEASLCDENQIVLSTVHPDGKVVTF